MVEEYFIKCYNIAFISNNYLQFRLFPFLCVLFWGTGKGAHRPCMCCKNIISSTHARNKPYDETSGRNNMLNRSSITIQYIQIQFSKVRLLVFFKRTSITQPVSPFLLNWLALLNCIIPHIPPTKKPLFSQNIFRNFPILDPPHLPQQPHPKQMSS